MRARPLLKWLLTPRNTARLQPQIRHSSAIAPAPLTSNDREGFYPLSQNSELLSLLIGKDKNTALETFATHLSEAQFKDLFKPHLLNTAHSTLRLAVRKKCLESDPVKLLTNQYIPESTKALILSTLSKEERSTLMSSFLLFRQITTLMQHPVIVKQSKELPLEIDKISPLIMNADDLLELKKFTLCRRDYSNLLGEMITIYPHITKILIQNRTEFEEALGKNYWEQLIQKIEDIAKADKNALLGIAYVGGVAVLGGILFFKLLKNREDPSTQQLIESTLIDNTKKGNRAPLI